MKARKCVKNLRAVQTPKSKIYCSIDFTLSYTKCGIG